MSQQRSRDTTEYLLNAAETLVIESGESALTLDRLVTQGHSSSGSVYERWPSRLDLWESLYRERVEPLLGGMPKHDSLADRLTFLKQSDDGRRLLTWVVEFLHLARNEPNFGSHARHLINALADYCKVGEGFASTDAVERGAQWWMCSVLVGNAQLRLGGATMPSMASAIEHLVGRPIPTDRGHQIRVDTSVRTSMSPRPIDPVTDDTSLQIIGVTRQLLADTSRPPTIRAILTRTGVSTKVLYRRFESRRELMLSLLSEELRRADTDWGRFLVEALSSSDPIGRLARVFRERVDTLTADPATRNVILGLTAQARTNAELRARIVNQVAAMALVRSEFFALLHRANLLHHRLTPDVCGWLVQLPAAGLRLMIGAGIVVNHDDFEAGTARVLWNSLAI